MSLTVDPLTGTIGAEVSGVDLREKLDADMAAELTSLLHEHLVLVFREHALTPEQQIEFGRAFGEIKNPPVRTSHGGPPEINVVSQDDPKGEGADNWHADNTYTADPPMGSILHVKELPGKGGDTMFANMYEAFATLSPPLQRMCEELTATHDITMSLTKAIQRGHSTADLDEIRSRFPPVVHPVVITHPVTGRKALFVNANSTVRINELSDNESDMVLRTLYEHVRAPDFHVRVRWDLSTVVILDNLATQHYAVPDYDERRTLHRVAIKGGVLA
ncbi:MAG: TauD/TfdA family dioxygenase [Acidimicrobiales bacterium]